MHDVIIIILYYYNIIIICRVTRFRTRKIIDQRIRGDEHNYSIAVSLIFYGVAKYTFNNAQLITNNIYQSLRKFLI